MTTDSDRTGHQQPHEKTAGGHTDEQSTRPAEEWGERLDTGKRIARGGKDQDHPPVPGAEEQPPRG